MNLDSIHNVYFLGIGGIGMSSLARYFHAMGRSVAGYDLTPSSITNELDRLGINIHFDDDISLISERFLNPEDTLVVRTPAVPQEQSELQYFISNSFRILKRSEVLGILFNKSRGMAIAGTHGKTSVSSMLGYIMDASKVGCTAFLGGILKNINSNLILNPSSSWVVAEADEYDRSFLNLTPEIALVTWVDADHLDIYQSEAEIERAFSQFVDQTKPGGIIILKKGIKLDYKKRDRKYYSYALDDKKADFYAKNIKEVSGRYIFDIATPKKKIQDIELQVIGKTNIENAVAAAAVAWAAGIKPDLIQAALSGFSGVQRRFDIQYQDEGCLYIDDYAHHPRELDAVIGSLKQLFPDRKITGIFQPHLYSRTKDFAIEFAASLSALDELILLDIYPARELPMEGVSSKLIFDRVSINDKELCNADALLDTLRGKKLDVLLTLGAGDIDRLVAPIKELIASQ